MSNPNPLIGILLMVLGSGLLSSKDGLVKTFLDQVGPFQMIWIQFAGTFAVMALVALPFHGRRVFRPASPGLQFIRGSLNVGAVTSLFWAISYIPLADATAMLMFAPAVATALSPYLLGEKIGVYRVAAVAVGFVGVLVILRPGFAADPIGYYIGLISGFCLGGYFIANRRLAGTQPVMLDITHNAFMGALAVTPLMAFAWAPVPEAVHGKLLIVLALSVVGQGAMIASFKFGPAAVISPYAYTILVFATLIGYVVFDTVPDAFTWTGIALIVGSGVFIAHRERRLSPET